MGSAIGSVGDIGSEGDAGAVADDSEFGEQSEFDFSASSGFEGTAIDDLDLADSLLEDDGPQRSWVGKLQDGVDAYEGRVRSDFQKEFDKADALITDSIFSLPGAIAAKFVHKMGEAVVNVGFGALNRVVHPIDTLEATASILTDPAGAAKTYYAQTSSVDMFGDLFTLGFGGSQAASVLSPVGKKYALTREEPEQPTRWVPGTEPASFAGVARDVTQDISSFLGTGHAPPKMAGKLGAASAEVIEGGGTSATLGTGLYNPIKLLDDESTAIPLALSGDHASFFGSAYPATGNKPDIRLAPKPFSVRWQPDSIRPVYTEVSSTPRLRRDFSENIEVTGPNAGGVYQLRYVYPSSSALELHDFHGSYKDGELSGAVKVHSGGKTFGYGDELLASAISALETKGLPVNSFAGRWFPNNSEWGSNSGAFLENTRKGLAPEAAARRTFTGNAMSELGYTKIEVPGTPDTWGPLIRPVFSKPDFSEKWGSFPYVYGQAMGRR